MSISIDDQKLLLVIINEYSQDNFPELSNNYYWRWQIVVLAKHCEIEVDFRFKKYFYKGFCS